MEGTLVSQSCTVENNIDCTVCIPGMLNDRSLKMQDLFLVTKVCPFYLYIGLLLPLLVYLVLSRVGRCFVHIINYPPYPPPYEHSDSFIQLETSL